MKPLQKQWQIDMDKSLQEVKQETFEEGFNNHYKNINYTEDSIYKETVKRDFLAGAKWQQERSFSLEQISKEFVGEGKLGGYFDDYLDYRIDNGNKITFKEWFEQFKKK
jgi:hypothetical protein